MIVADFRPSPNFDERPAGAKVDVVVIHNISLPPGEFGGPHIEELFQNRLHPGAHPYFAGIAALEVSAHFLIRRDGEVIQFVDTAHRAWHAGASSWNGRERVNDFSIGIELEGLEGLPFESAQYRQLRRLLRLLRARHPQLEAAGHEDVAPGRKHDPGAGFEWQQLRGVMPRGLREA
jgi:N-acetyl-anhydromuramoyl-L-alanine amidase